jgi:four helix bundle protein
MKKSFRDLFVWRSSVEVAVRIAAIADVLCVRRRFALADQMQRSSVSVASNIAEGHGRLTPRERRHYLGQARGSAYELETQIEIAAQIVPLAPDEIAAIRLLNAKITCGLTKMIDQL